MMYVSFSVYPVVLPNKRRRIQIITGKIITKNKDQVYSFRVLNKLKQLFLTTLWHSVGEIMHTRPNCITTL